MFKRIRLFVSAPLVCCFFLLLLLFSISPATHAQSTPAAGTIPSLTVKAESSSPSVRNGDKVTFTVVVENNGTLVANDVTVSEFLPLPYVDLLHCQTDAPAGCKTEGSAQVINFPSLAVGERRQISFVTQARSNYLHLTNTNHRVTVTSLNGDTNLLDNQALSSIQLLKPVDLSIAQGITAPSESFPGEVITVSLAVKNIEPNPVSTVQYHSFKNSAAIVMSDTVLHHLQPALTYPSLITVSGITQPVVNVEVGLYAISRTWSEDVDILLVGPTGISVTLLSDVGGATALGGADLIFSDNSGMDATSQDRIPAGIYRPTNFARLDESLLDTYPSPGPGDVLDPVPFLGRFNGLDPNGVWRLYVVDDQPQDAGVIQAGWGITFTELVTRNIPILLEHHAPDLNYIGTISAPGWKVTPTVDGFVASTLASGQSPLSGFVMSATTPLLPGTYPLTTTVKPIFGEMNVSNNLTQTSFSTLAQSDLSVTGTVTPLAVLYGQSVTYTFAISNFGPTSALNGVLKVAVDDELSVASAVASIGSCAISGAKVTCDSGVLRPVGSATDVMTVTILAKTPGGGLPGPIPLLTTATVEGENDLFSDNNQVILRGSLADAVRNLIFLPIVTKALSD